MIEWLQRHKSVLSIRAIEQQLNMPDSTLIKAVNESRTLPKKWEQPLEKFLTEIGYKPN
jgi:hypothetical protein